MSKVFGILAAKQNSVAHCLDWLDHQLYQLDQWIDETKDFYDFDFHVEVDIYIDIDIDIHVDIDNDINIDIDIDIDNCINIWIDNNIDIDNDIDNMNTDPVTLNSVHACFLLIKGKKINNIKWAQEYKDMLKWHIKWNGCKWKCFFIFLWWVQIFKSGSEKKRKRRKRDCLNKFLYGYGLVLKS